MTEEFNKKEHWENIYKTKSLEEVSWYQAIPQTSLDFVEGYNLSKKAKIIDIGGGDSFFVDSLLKKGYQDITVLDISESAIERAKKRLGDKSHKIKWIVADISAVQLPEKYDLWHDRAVLHFLTARKDIENYLQITQESIKNKGTLLIATFSEEGPTKCSGIEIKQYSEDKMIEVFEKFFVKEKCFKVDHTTPSGKNQNFLFCSFRKIISKN